MYKELKRLECYNLLEVFLKKGIISCSISTQKRIYERYIEYIKNDLKSSQAILNVSKDFKMSERTVCRALNKMK